MVTPLDSYFHSPYISAMLSHRRRPGDIQGLFCESFCGRLWVPRQGSGHREKSEVTWKRTPKSLHAQTDAEKTVNREELGISLDILSKSKSKSKSMALMKLSGLYLFSDGRGVGFSP